MLRPNITVGFVLSSAMGLALFACSSDSGTNPTAPGASGSGGSVSTAGSGGSGGSTTTAGTGGSGDTGGAGGGVSPGGTGGTGDAGGTGGTGGSDVGGTAGGGGDGNLGGTGGAGGSAPAGPFTLTVEGFTMDGDRMCYPPASNDNGNMSPPMSWGPTPPGTMSFVHTVEDRSDNGPHMVICNILPTITSFEADIGMDVPEGADWSVRHANKANVGWYGPGAGNVRNYDIRIWALATPMLEGGCDNASDAFEFLVDNEENLDVVLASSGVDFWGNASGSCR